MTLDVVKAPIEVFDRVVTEEGVMVVWAVEPVDEKHMRLFLRPIKPEELGSG